MTASTRVTAAMRLILLALLVSFIGLSTTPVRANTLPQTTGDFYNACKPVAGTQSFTLQGQALFRAGYCLGMIEALQFNLGTNCLFGYEDKILRQADVKYRSLSALAQAFVNYARDNPQDWQLTGVAGMTKAFEEYFPCK